MSYQNMSPLNRRLQKSIELLKPPPKQTVSEWAVANRILSSEASAESGKYHLARAPFQKGWQDAISNPRIHTIVGMTSAQVGKTETFLNTELNLFNVSDLDLLTNATVFKSLDGSNRIRSDIKFDLKYDILSSDFFIKLGVTFNYDSKPIESATDKDYIVQTTFGWEL